MKGFPRCKASSVCVANVLAIALSVAAVMAAQITQEDKLRKAEELAFNASEMAVMARQTYDIVLARKAFELADMATTLVLQVVTEAQKEANPELAQAAIDTADRIVNAIDQIIATTTFIAKISTNPKTIADAKEILEKAKEAKDLNTKTVRIVSRQLIEPVKKVSAKPEPPIVPIPPDTETTEQEAYQQEASPSQ